TTATAPPGAASGVESWRVTGVVPPAGAAGEATSLAQAPMSTAAVPSSGRARSRAIRRASLKRNGMLHSFHRWFLGNKTGRRELEELLGFPGGPADVATFTSR